MAGETLERILVKFLGGPKSQEAKFPMLMYDGAPIFRPPNGTVFNITRDKYRVTSLGGLKPGDQIFVPMLKGYVRAEVEAGTFVCGMLHAKSEGSHGHTLKYLERQPEEPCWCVVGSYRLRRLRRLSIYGQEGPQRFPFGGHFLDMTVAGRALLDQVADEYLMEILDEISKENADT